MTESTLALDQESTRYPLSYTQEWFITSGESTVAGWAAELRRILAGAVREPDRYWRLLAGPASRHEHRV